MKSYIKLTVAVIALIAVIFTGANFILNNAGKGDEGGDCRSRNIQKRRVKNTYKVKQHYAFAYFQVNHCAILTVI